MSLSAVMHAHGISQRQLARDAGLSLAAVNAAVRGLWPKRRTAAARAAVCQALRAAGASVAELKGIALPPASACAAKKLAPGAATPEAAPVNSPSQGNHCKELHMLFDNQNLYPEAMRHFKLARSPFLRNLPTEADVFKGSGYQYAYAALEFALESQDFVAIIGESGAGKSVVLRELEQACLPAPGAAGSQKIIVRPYVAGMDENDVKGKTLKARDIGDAIAAALEPGTPLASGGQKRMRQLHTMLCDAVRQHKKVLLVIDEAHRLPIPTLNHLKDFLEMSHGRGYVMGIALIGQPELRNRLKRLDSRQISSRLQVHELGALRGEEVAAYLRHRLARVGAAYDAIFAPDAAAAIEAALFMPGAKPSSGQSYAYPQVLHNFVTRCMNAVALVGYDKVDAEVVASVLKQG